MLLDQACAESRCPVCGIHLAVPTTLTCSSELIHNIWRHHLRTLHPDEES